MSGGKAVPQAIKIPKLSCRSLAEAKDKGGRQKPRNRAEVTYVSCAVPKDRGGRKAIRNTYFKIFKGTP